MSDYHRLSKDNRMLALSGAPISVLSSRSKNEIAFVAIMEPRLNILVDTNMQTACYEQLLSPEVDVGQDSLILVGCSSSMAGLKLAANVCEKFMQAESATNPFPFVKWLDVSRWDFDFLNEHQSQKGIVVVYGLDKNSDSKRISHAKDYIRVAAGSTVVVVVETDDVIGYMNDVLNIQPDLLFKLGKPVKQRTKI